MLPTDSGSSVRQRSTPLKMCVQGTLTSSRRSSACALSGDCPEMDNSRLHIPGSHDVQAEQPGLTPYWPLSTNGWHFPSGLLLKAAYWSYSVHLNHDINMSWLPEYRFHREDLGEIIGLPRGDHVVQFRGIPFADLPGRFRQSHVEDSLPHVPFDARQPGYVFCFASKT